MKYANIFKHKSALLAVALMSVAASVYAFVAAPHNTLSGESVRVDAVTKGELNIFVDGFGQFVALDNFTITAPAMGIVEQVHKRSGDHVEKGDVLVSLKNRELLSALSTERSRLASAQLELRKVQQEVEAEVTDQQASISIERTKLALSKLKLEAKEKLASTGVVSELEMAEAQMNYQLAALTLDSQSQKLTQLEHRAARKIDIQMQEIALIKQAVHERQQDVDALTILAPNSGWIAQLEIQAGDSATFGQKLGQVKGNREFAVLAQFPQHVAGKLQRGNKVDVTFLDKQVEGQIIRVLPGVSNGFIQTEVGLSHSVSDVVEDMEVKVNVNVNSYPDVLYVKTPEGLTRGDEADVYRITDNLAHKTRVSIKRFEGQYMVLSGSDLQEGDQIIVSNMRSFTGQDAVLIQ